MGLKIGFRLRRIKTKAIHFFYLLQGRIGAPPTFRVTANNVARQTSNGALRATNLAVAVTQNV